ncbi:von Willebrand factor A domain-containing protein 5A isoform X1 [Prionailurus iriomotensis]
MPLKSICVTLSIREFVAGVAATLNYENEEKFPLETFFVFPMDEDSAVYSFEAMVDGKTIKAELKDKKKAHIIYESAISHRHQAFLLEEDKCSRDVFCCNVGNLQPGSKVALTLKYVQELPLEADGALRYVLPAVLNPRYRCSGSPEDSCLDLKTPIVPLDDLPYAFSMTATVSSQHGIETIQSNCPLSPIEYLGDKKTSAQISLADGHKFDRDVELLIYYREVHTPSVAVELGNPKNNPVDLDFLEVILELAFKQIFDELRPFHLEASLVIGVSQGYGLMKDPSAMVCFYPNIPEVEPSAICGEFVFLMDCSGSMQCPISKQDKSQLRIEAAKGNTDFAAEEFACKLLFQYLCIWIFLRGILSKNSVKYTQDTMEEALRRVKLMRADLGGTEILTPLQVIYREPSTPGHPLQLDGEVTDTFSIIKEVRNHRLRHRCFSFGIGEGASTSLIKGIARVGGGTSEFITGKDRMQAKALRALKHALQPAVEDVSVNWDLPRGLSAKTLSPEQTVLYKGQRLIVYAQLTGTMPPEEGTGEVCLNYTLQGKSCENKVTFSLQPKLDDNFTIHRLAAKAFLQSMDIGFGETPAKTKKDVLKVSIDCGVISSHTAFIAINKDVNKPVQGPLACRDIPRPVLLGAAAQMPQCKRVGSARIFGCRHGSQPPPNIFQAMKLPVQDITPLMDLDAGSWGFDLPTRAPPVFGETYLVQLISLQNADGSWDLDEDLARILGISLKDLWSALPVKDADSSSWATVLAVVWLHAKAKHQKCEWELLEKKARTWINSNAGSIKKKLVKAAIAFTKSSVDPAVFGV